MSTCAQCKMKIGDCLNWFDFKTSAKYTLKTSIVEWNIMVGTFPLDANCARIVYEIF